MSIRFGFPAIFLTSLVMFAGGAVPGFFLIPFKLAVKAILLTRTSQVAGTLLGREDSPYETYLEKEECRMSMLCKRVGVDIWC